MKIVAIPRYLKGTKEELLSYYPTFYRNVKEFVALQEAIAKQLDKLFEAFQICGDDSNILTASENVIAFFEKIIGIKYASLRTLEERRRLILVYYNIFGKVSASKIKSVLSFYTEADVNIKFTTKDSNGNYILEIVFDGIKKGGSIDLENINILLKKIIPAHLQYCSRIDYKQENTTYTAVSVNTAMKYTVTQDINKKYNIENSVNTASVINIATSVVANRNERS